MAASFRAVSTSACSAVGRSVPSSTYQPTLRRVIAPALSPSTATGPSRIAAGAHWPPPHRLGRPLADQASPAAAIGGAAAPAAVIGYRTWLAVHHALTAGFRRSRCRNADGFLYSVPLWGRHSRKGDVECSMKWLAVIVTSRRCVTLHSGYNKPSRPIVSEL